MMAITVGVRCPLGVHGVRNLYVLLYQLVNQISRSARNDTVSYFADIYLAQIFPP